MIEFLVFVFDLVFTVFWVSAAVGLLVPRVGNYYIEKYNNIRLKGRKHEGDN